MNRINSPLVISMFLVLVLFFSAVTCRGEIPEEKFARKVLSLVLKKDINKIYLMTTEEFKKSTSITQLKNMIDKVSTLYKGKIVKTSLVKFSKHSELNISELWLKLDYDDGLWMYVGLFLKKQNEKFKILGIKFNVCPQVATKAIQSYPYYQEVLDFCKNIFSYIKAGEIDKVMYFVSDKVKNKVGTEFIRNFLNSIKGSEAKKLINFKWNNIENGYWYHLIFQGSLKDADVNMEIILIRTKGHFEIIDINYTKPIQ